MAKFLDTEGITYHIKQIIKNSNDKIYLMSPYLQVNRRIKEELIDKDKFELDIRLIYGKAELSSDELDWIEDLSNMRLYYNEYLHAKCYLNEDKAIITSMNLYDFSQKNNVEMGILVERDEDSELYSQIYDEVMRVQRNSERTEIDIKTISHRDEESDESSDKGYCIRCKEEIELDPKRPYCSDCFSSWNEYKNGDYKENHCHICGKEMESTRNKPVCYDCYMEHKDALDFPETKGKSDEEESSSEKEEKGYCIRCEKEIELDPTSPYCSDCYETWSEYENEEYEEDHCHICGKEMDSTKKKPTCYDCYKEYKDELDFPSG